MSEQIFSKYYNRDLSWLLFNRRVINQSRDETIPLLERLRFLAIASSNLDEYYSVRVPSIQEIIRVAPQARDNKTGHLQKDIRDQICERNRKNVDIQYTNYDNLIDILDDEQVFGIRSYTELSEEEKDALDIFFDQSIFPCLTSIQFDQYHAHPRYVDGELNIYIRSFYEDEEVTTVIPISDKLDRLIPLIKEDRYVFLEDLIMNNIDKILPDNKIINKFVFRITRDKDIELDNDIETDVLDWVKMYVKQREKGRPTRLEYSGDNINQHSTDIAILNDMLGLEKKSSYNIQGPLDLTFLFKLIKNYSKSYPELIYPPFHPIEPKPNHDIFEKIDNETLLFQHPYESFDFVVELLKEAVGDPNTVAIKQTIYRVADDSEIVEQLVKAAKSGIQVTVVVELKARFDEENNIALVDKLTEAGCYVSFGKEDLKTHSKAMLIIKKTENGTKGYAHFGTGNYNEDTSKVYTDLSLLTCDEDYIDDAEQFFNYMVNDIEVPDYKLISTSPTLLKPMILEKIKLMKKHYLKTGKGKIFFKANALTDRNIIDALYSAAKAGVPIRIVIRGACCMKVGICGENEDVVISSIVGRFLEHSRIYGFYWGGENNVDEAEFWIASADLMTRNMEDRVEIATPVRDKELKTKLANIVNIFASDTKGAYYLNKDGRYKKLQVAEKISSQETFMKIAEAGQQVDTVKLKPIENPVPVRRTDRYEVNNKNVDNFQFSKLFNIVMIILLVIIVVLMVQWIL
ncbi:polyphosphate kinase 1 [Floricoccus penangensis]|uniref:Polyphosphate kinase n=1 Tax=Floricoccus penangensis TaxID=1859475 RepID=A0A9Q5JGF6_9LACT|nr:polyphosphate kinase 1 [Floricoccus penangensis]OFI46871.1 polyphosphate kinase 1 [Floricoccus penangensis]